ncbi:MAG: hypothetical protein AAFX94_23775 [Myxococcota bacterium]
MQGVIERTVGVADESLSEAEPSKNRRKPDQEGFIQALAAAGVVLLLGRPFAGLLLGALALLPVVVFSAALSSLGLDPLPNSVNAKLPDPAAEEAGLLMGLANTFRFNI